MTEKRIDSRRLGRMIGKGMALTAIVLGAALLGGCTFRSSHYGGPHHSGGSVEIGYGGYGYGGYGWECEHDDRRHRHGRRNRDRCR